MQPSTGWSVALAALLLAVLTLQPARINAAATHHQGTVLIDQLIKMQSSILHRLTRHCLFALMIFRILSQNKKLVETRTSERLSEGNRENSRRVEFDRLVSHSSRRPGCAHKFLLFPIREGKKKKERQKSPHPHNKQTVAANIDLNTRARARSTRGTCDQVARIARIRHIASIDE